MNDRCSGGKDRVARLQALGRTVRVALVGCGSQKRLEPRPARKLYTSNLFRAAVEHAEQTTDEFWIISAFHGLLHPDTETEPYDRNLKKLRKSERESWAARVAWSLTTNYVGLEVELVIYAGRDYAAPLRSALHFARPRLKGTVTEPLAGLRVGERLAWFKRRRLHSKPQRANATAYEGADQP
jgi:hypothetical protein